MHEPGRSKDQLFKLERLQSLQQPLRPLNRHRVMGGVVLSAEVEEGSKVDTGGDPVALGQPHPCEGLIDA